MAVEWARASPDSLPLSTDTLELHPELQAAGFTVETPAGRAGDLLICEPPATAINVLSDAHPQSATGLHAAHSSARKPPNYFRYLREHCVQLTVMAGVLRCLQGTTSCRTPTRPTSAPTHGWSASLIKLLTTSPPPLCIGRNTPNEGVSPRPTLTL